MERLQFTSRCEHGWVPTRACFLVAHCRLLLASSQGRRLRAPGQASSVKALIPFVRAPHSCPRDFPQAPPQYTIIILGFGTSAYGFRGGRKQSDRRRSFKATCLASSTHNIPRLGNQEEGHGERAKSADEGLGGHTPAL